LIGTRGITFDIEVHGSTVRFPLEIEQQLLRIGREAIANAVYHSQGSRIRVELTYSAAGLLMSIADNGRGFDPATQAAVASGHFGLAGMRYPGAATGRRPGGNQFRQWNSNLPDAARTGKTREAPPALDAHRRTTAVAGGDALRFRRLSGRNQRILSAPRRNM